MNIIDLKQQIIQNKLDNFYVFTGSEIGIINTYLNHMSTTMKLPIQRPDTVLSIYSKCTAKSMFGSTGGFYVIRNDMDFIKQEKLYTNIKKDIGANIIVVLYEKIDSRLKFGKYFKDCTIDFERLATNIIVKYIKKESNLSDGCANKLAGLCSNCYDICMMECDKILQYASSTKCTPDCAFNHLIESGVIFQPEGTDVFEFTDAVCAGDVSKAFHMNKILMENGVSPINILGTLYDRLKTIMLIQSYGSGSGVCDVTGLDSRQVYFNKKYCNRYSTEHLVYSIKFIAKMISYVKSGEIDESVVVENVLAHIM